MRVTAKKFFSYSLVLFIGLNLFGCASPYYVKKIPDFEQRISQVKTIGVLDPIDYTSNKNKETDASILQSKIIEKIKASGAFIVKLISKDKFEDGWNSDIERVANDSREILKEIELEGIWKDKKKNTIERKLFDDIKLFNSLDPELDALLIIKANQHYGNPWAYGWCAFGALGGIIATSTAEKDPVLGRHTPGSDEAYSSALLIDLDTSDVLWYNFSVKVDMNVEAEKHAEIMAGYIVQGLAK